MTIYKVVIAPTNLYGTHDVEFSANTNTSTHLVYLVDLSAATYSGCSLYHPYLTNTGASYSLLSCGPLISNTATIGNYVIDWHLNSTSGETVLISGNSGNTDPAIAAYHTFTDVPVPGGNLYPIIRYVYIDGFKYVSVYDGSARYSPDFINCLDPITIQNMNCGNGTLIGQTYTHIISYTFGGSSSELSTRSLNFDLNSDGSTKYLAWEFTGSEVPDTLKITYTGSTTNETTYWTVGSQATTNYNSTPKVYGSGYQSLKSVSNLTGITYVTNDKLKIEVTPNVNSNTNWTLKMKCMTGTTFNSTNFPIGVNVINPASINMQYITGSTCYYKLNFNVMSGNTLFNNSDLNKYFSVISRSLFVYSTSDTNMYVQLTAPMSAYTYSNILSQGSCTSGQTSNSVTTISQSGNIITLSFNDIDDYNIYKNAYNYVTGLTNMNNYSTDPTSVNHYKKIILYALSGTSCGDVKANDYAYFHISSPVTFDDANKIITISMVNITNGLSSLSGITCNNGYDIANNFINYIPLSNSNITTKIRYTNPFGGWYMYGPNVTSLQTDATNDYFYVIHPSILNNAINLTAPWAFSTGGTGDVYIDQYPGHYLMIKARIKVTITNSSDPLNNYIVYNGVDYNTGQIVPFYQIYP